MQVKVIKIDKQLYQVEVGKIAVVIRAKDEKEALNKACKYLDIQCNRHSIQAI